MPGFPLFLPLSFPGGDTPYVPARPTVAGTALAWVESYCDEGNDLLLSQFRQDLPRIRKVLCVFLDEVQALDDASWAVLTERGLDAAVGVQLDGIGQIVNLARAGWSDDVYRLILAAQIIALRSGGTWPDLTAVLDAVTVDLTLARVFDVTLAAAHIDLGAPPPAAIGALEIFQILERARPAGVRLTLLFPVDPLTSTLTWAPSGSTVPFADVGEGWGDSTTPGTGGTWAGLLASSADA